MGRRSDESLAVTLLTSTERVVLERIRDRGTAGDIADAWAIEKGWAERSATSVKLTASGTGILRSDEQDKLATTEKPQV